MFHRTDMHNIPHLLPVSSFFSTYCSHSFFKSYTTGLPLTSVSCPVYTVPRTVNFCTCISCPSIFNTLCSSPPMFDPAHLRTSKLFPTMFQNMNSVRVVIPFIVFTITFIVNSHLGRVKRSHVQHNEQTIFFVCSSSVTKNSCRCVVQFSSKSLCLETCQTILLLDTSYA